jgi:hypothetical protein
MPARDEPPNSHSSAHRQELEREIAKEEMHLRRLDAEQAEAKARLSALQNELATLDLAPAPVRAPTKPLADGPRTPADSLPLRFCLNPWDERFLRSPLHVRASLRLPSNGQGSPSGCERVPLSTPGAIAPRETLDVTQPRCGAKRETIALAAVATLRFLETVFTIGSTAECARP